MDVFLIVLQFLLQLGDGLRVSLGLAQLLDGRLQASEVLSGELGTDRRLTAAIYIEKNFLTSNSPVKWRSTRTEFRSKSFCLS